MKVARLHDHEMDHLSECVGCGYGGHNKKSATEVRWRDGDELHLCAERAEMFDEVDTDAC